MKRTTISLSLGFPAAFLVGSLAGLPVQGPARSDLSKAVAVVDLQRVLESYPNAGAELEALREQATRVQARLQSMEERNKQLQMEVEGYERGSKEWTEAVSVFEGAKATFETLAKREQQRLDYEKARIEEQAIRAVRAAVSELATKKGLQLVLRLSVVPDEAPLAERLTRHELVTVLHHDRALDMTDDVIEFLKAAPADGAKN